MRFFLSRLDTVKEMTMLDIAIYKIMLIAIGCAFISSVPAFGAIHSLIFVLILLLCHGYLAFKTYHQRTETRGFIATAIANFHEYTFMEILAFETGLVIFGMLVYQLVPAMSFIHPLTFTAWATFGMGWVFSMWKHQK